MLLGEGERPRASGMQPAAAQATNGLVIDLRHAAAQLWASSADAIKAACGPHMPTGLVDEYDVLAWLTADALGRPPLHPDDTNTVGKRIAAQAARVEKKLQAEAESMRKAVGKARAAAAKKPELLPKVAAAEATGEKARAVLLEKPYDAQLPATTVGEKRSESHWRQREVKQICAKSAKLDAAATAAEAAYDAANARFEPLRERVFEGDRSTLTYKDLDAFHAANHRWLVTKQDFILAKHEASKAEALKNEILAAAAAEEAVDVESEDDDDFYCSGDHPMAETFIRQQITTPMVRAVSMHAAGFAECAACAMLAMRQADRLAVDEDDATLEKYDSYGLYSSELHEWLELSRPIEDTYTEGRHIAAASGWGHGLPSDCAKRCAQCTGSTDSWLTMVGKQELVKAFLAGERARLLIREQRILPLLGL